MIFDEIAIGADRDPANLGLISFNSYLAGFY